MRKVHSRLMMV